jgi:hypothetical protein
MTKHATMLGWTVAIAFVIVGAINVAVVLFPIQLGDTNWEVAAFGELASSFAVPTLGVVLLGFVAGQRGAAGVVLLVSLWSALLATIVTFGGAFLALDIPVVIQATRGGTLMQSQVRMLVGKSIVFSGLYALTLWFLAAYFAQAFVRLRRVR